MPDTPITSTPARKIHEYLMNKGAINGLPERFEDFDKGFRDPRVANAIYGLLKKDKEVTNLPDDFDSFFYKVYPEKEQETKDQLTAAKEKGYEDVELIDEDNGLPEATPPEPEKKEPEPVEVLTDKGIELREDGEEAESVEDQIQKISSNSEEEMSKPKLLKAMVRQKLADVDRLLDSDRLKSIDVELEAGNVTDVKNRAGKVMYQQRRRAKSRPTPESKSKLSEKERLMQAKEIYEGILNMPDHDTDNNAMENFLTGLQSAGYEHIPFVGSIKSIYQAMNLKGAYEDQATAGDASLLEAAGIEQMVRQDPDLKPPTGYSIGEGIVEMVPYMAEFAMTGGAYSIGKKAAIKGIQKAIISSGDDAIKAYAKSSGGKAFTRVAGELTGSMLQTYANPQAIAKNTIERMTPEYTMIMGMDENELATMIPDDGEEFGEAFLKGLGVSYSEFLTERFGQHVMEGMSKKKALEFMKKISIGEWATRRGFKNLAQTNQAFKKAGWNGVFAETYLEEYPNGLANAFITGDRPLIEALNPASEEMKMTLYTMLVMGGIGQGGRAARAGKNRVKDVVAAAKAPNITQNGNELTREAALEKIGEGDIGGMVIKNDQKLEEALRNKAAAMRSAGQEVPGLAPNSAEAELMEEIKGEEDAQLKERGGVIDEEEGNEDELINSAENGKIKRKVAGEYVGKDSQGNPTRVIKENGVWSIQKKGEKGWDTVGDTKTLTEAKELLSLKDKETTDKETLLDTEEQEKLTKEKEKEDADKEGRTWDPLVIQEEADQARENIPATKEGIANTKKVLGQLKKGSKEHKIVSKALADLEQELGQYNTALAREKELNEADQAEETSDVKTRIFQTKTGLTAKIDYEKQEITRVSPKMLGDGTPAGKEKVHKYPSDEAFADAIKKYENSKDFKETTPKAPAKKAAPKKRTAPAKSKAKPATSKKKPPARNTTKKKDGAKKPAKPAATKSESKPKASTKSTKTSTPTNKAFKSGRLVSTKGQKAVYEVKDENGEKHERKISYKRKKNPNTVGGYVYDIINENGEVVDQVKRKRDVSQAMMSAARSPLPAKKETKKPETKKKTTPVKIRTDEEVTELGEKRLKELEKSNPQKFEKVKKSVGLIPLVRESIRLGKKMGEKLTAQSKRAYELSRVAVTTAMKEAGLEGYSDQQFVYDYAKAHYAKEFINREVVESEESGKKTTRKATEKEKAEAEKKRKAREKAEKEAEEEIERTKRLYDEGENEEQYSAEDKTDNDIQNEIYQKSQEQKRNRPAVRKKESIDGPIYSVSEIMRKLARITDAPSIYKKKLKKPGLYNTKFGNIVIRMEGALSTMVHELGHSFQDKYKLVTNMTESVYKEISWLSEHGSEVPKGLTGKRAEMYERGEAVAEAIRQWMIDPDGAAFNHPGFVEYFERVVPDKKIKQMREVGNDIRNLFSASPTEVMLSNTTLGSKEKDAYLKWLMKKDGGKFFKLNWLDRLRVQILDDHHVFDKFVGKALKMHGIDKGEILPEHDPRVLLALNSGLHSKLDNLLANGLVDFRNNRVLTEDGQRMTYRWLMGLFDSATNSTFIADKHFTAAWGIAERTREILDREVKDYEDFEKHVILGFMKEHGLTGEEGMTRSEAIAYLIKMESKIAQLEKATRRRKGKTEEEIEAEKGLKSELKAQRRVIFRGLKAYQAKVVAGLGGDFYSDAAEVNRMLGEADKLKQEDPDRYARLQEAKDRYREYADKVMRYAVEGGRLAQKIRAKSVVGDRFDEKGVEYERTKKGWSRNGEDLDMEESREIEDKWLDEYGELIGGYEYIKKHNQYYIALHRVTSHDNPDEDWGSKAQDVKVAKGVGTVNNLIMQLRGSAKEVKDPYEALLDQMYKTIKETDQNNIRRQFINLVIGDEVFESKYGIVPRDGIESGTPKDGNLFEVGGLKPLGEAVLPYSGNKKENKLVVYKDGLKHEFNIPNAELYAAFKGLTDDGGWKWLTNLKNIIQQSITLSPQFAWRNFQRDIQSRYILGISTPLTDMKNFKAPGDSWESMMDLHGGGQFGYYDRTQSDLYKNIEADLKADLIKGMRSKEIVVAKLRKAGRSYKDFLAKSEKYNRQAEFKARYYQAKNKLGMDEHNARLYAAYKARGLIDFARGGVITKKLNRYIPFFNAGIQGLVAAGKSAQANPLGFVIRLAVVNAIPTLIEQSILDFSPPEAEEEYNQLPAYRKDFFINIWIGKGRWILIPKPFELGLVGSAAARAYRKAGGDKNAFEGFGGNVLNSLFPPLHSPANFLGGLKPIVEAMILNKDLYRDQDIVPYREKMLSLRHRKETEGWKRASAFGRGVGETVSVMKEAIGLDPLDARQVDHLVKGYTTYMGSMFLGGIDYIMGKDNNSQYRDWQAMTGVVKGTPVWGSRDVQFVLENAQSSPNFREFSTDMMDMLKAYVLIEEGPLKEKMKNTIFEVAKEEREELELLMDLNF